MPIDYLYYHCKAIEEAEDRADRELAEKTEINQLPNNHVHPVFRDILNKIAFPGVRI